MNGQLTVGSLFSGIEGFGFGFERAGMRVVWHCEQNEYCQRVIRKHWPANPIYRDIRQLRGADIEPVDVLCGGFPCQDISLAGAGAGIDGARSGLWSEYARLVGELRPRYVVVENVTALLGRGFGRVLGDLASLGYDAEWDCLPASAFGAPHRRDRIWIVAYPDGSGCASREHNLSARQPDLAGSGTDMADANRERRSGWRPRERPDDEPRPSASLEPARRDPLADTDGVGRSEGLQRPSGREQQQGTPDAERNGQHADSGALQPWRVGGRVAQAGGSEWWAVEPPMGRVAHGVPDRLDQLAALGNALVPQVAEWIGERIVRLESQRRASEAA